MSARRPIGILPLAAAALASTAGAQSVYIDFGILGLGAPSASYAAAAGAPGHWNEETMPELGPSPLVGIAGEATELTWSSHSCEAAGEDFPNTSGDDAQLLDDWIYGDCGVDTPTIDIAGFLPGEYLLYVYPKGDAGGFVRVTASSVPSGTGGVVLLPAHAAFSGSFASWTIGVLPLRFNAPSTTLHMTLFTDAARGVSGIQVVRVGDVSPSSTPYCFGDGSGATCPCANPGASGHGCANVAYADGALLGASGTASVSSDSLTLIATSMSGLQSWYFQGTAQDALPFGRGIQCLSGTIVRVGMKGLVGGSSTNPSGVDLPMSVKGGIPPAGATRHYQVAYRQVNPPCVPTPLSNTNRTNGVTVVWTP